MIKITIPIMISIHGHSSKVDKRMINIPGEVNGMYEPTFAAVPAGSDNTGPRKIKGKKGNISTSPRKFPVDDASSIGARSPTNIEATNKEPNIAILRRTGKSGPRKD